MHGVQGGERGDDPVPRLAADCMPTRLSLSPAEGFLLSRIDGVTPWSMLREIAGIPAEDVDRCLARWLDEGVLVLARGKAIRSNAAHEADRSKPPSASAAGPTPAASAAPGAERAAAPPPPPEKVETAVAPPAAKPVIDESLLDASLELPLETQRRVLEFEHRLELPYHEILGIAPDADVKAVKKAYFALSRVFHPDRYFRRNLGPFAKRVDSIFKGILEAYELLSDPITREEVQRSLAAQSRVPAPAPVAPPPAAPVAAAAAPGAETDSAARDAEEEARNVAERIAAARGARRRLGSRLSLLTGHRRALEERKRKAKTFFETGMAAFRAERWLEAAGSVRLALAYDPGNAAFKESFVDVQRKAHEERAKTLVREAEAALDLREWGQALRLFEEALTYRPFDADLHHRTGRLAWQGANDHRRAKEYVTAACELDSGKAAYRRTLGQIYSDAGLKANARRELEAALRLAPDDREIRAELRSL